MRRRFARRAKRVNVPGGFKLIVRFLCRGRLVVAFLDSYLLYVRFPQRSQEVAGFPERNGYHFRLFSGETIKIKPDGSFHIAERKCSGKAFLGIAHC